MLLGFKLLLKKSFWGSEDPIVIEVVLKEWPTLFLFILVLTKGVEYVQFMMQNKRPIVLESQNVDISNFKLFVPLVIIVSRNLNF